MSTTTGQCLCGTVRYRVTGPLGEVRYCHCRMCRRATGSAFPANAPVPLERFALLAGAESMTEGARPRPRPNQTGWPGAAGRCQITGHVWTESKADWHAIHDDLPQYLQGFGSGNEELDVGEIGGTQ